MSIKGRKLCIMFCVICSIESAALAEAAPSAWDGSPVGECLSKYKIPKPTEDYPVKVQVVKNVDTQKNSYVWIWDPTPERNPTRQLIRITPKRVGCTVLFMPFSEFNDFKLAPDGNLPDKVTSTLATVNSEQGSYFFEHDYHLDKTNRYYEKLPTCYKVKVGSSKREKVNCDQSVE